MNTRPPLFFLIFFSIFGFIGLTLLISLWTASGFGAPPLIFRIFGSFIAVAFMAMGFGVPYAALTNKTNPQDLLANIRPKAAPKPSGNYDCPNCGANVGDADVSPSGDLKCQYCNNWWNIHQV